MRAGRFLALTLALTVFAPLAQAQDEMTAPPAPPQDAYLDARVGTWQGTGTMMGMSMTETTTAEWILGHQFFVHRSNTTMTMPDGQAMTMEMHMVAKPNGDGTYAGIYMDSWGMAGEYTGRMEGASMVMEWTDPVEGHNHRAVETPTADGWSMQFFTQQPDGSWAESGAMTYTRAAE